MTDMHCGNCGEPWDVVGLDTDVEPDEKQLILSGKGCPVCRQSTNIKVDEVAQPSVEDLMAMESEGYSIDTDGCRVEPDGVCQHGCNSWLIELGLI